MIDCKFIQSNKWIRQWSVIDEKRDAVLKVQSNGKFPFALLKVETRNFFQSMKNAQIAF